MAEKCIGVREDTGDQCNRSASSGSDFCYIHQSQEGNERIAHLEHDAYHCPEDGQQLLYVPKKDYHRCKSCKGVLLSAKGIGQEYAGKISQLNEIERKQEVCPSCVDSAWPRASVHGAGANLSIHEVEWTYETDGYGPFGNKLRIGSRTEYEIANVWLCNNCGSLWVPGVNMGAFKSPTAGLNLLFGYEWGWIGHSTWLDNQVKWREKRLEGEAMNEQRLELLRAKWCNHMDDQGEQCRKNKSQKSTHDPEYCYKHQPK